MAFDFKKEFREYYMPKNKPEIVTVPKANYIALRGKGNPNEEGGEYKQAVGILYAIAMADFTMRYICPMQERLLLRNGRL